MIAIVHFAMATFTYSDVLTLLSVIAVGMLIVLLFNLILVSASLKRLSQRLDRVSRDIESVVLKPIGVIDSVVDWVVGALEHAQIPGSKKHRAKKE